MKLLLFFILAVTLSSKVNADEDICLGSGFILDASGKFELESSDQGSDFSEHNFRIKDRIYSLYIGFHPWIQKSEDRVLELDFVSRYGDPIIKILSKGKDDCLELEIVMIRFSEDFGKPVYFYFLGKDADLSDEKQLITMLREIRYSPESCEQDDE